jgi:hypothetical protein
MYREIVAHFTTSAEAPNIKILHIGRPIKPPPRTKRCGTRVTGAEIVKTLSDAMPFLAYPRSSTPMTVLPVAAEKLGNLNGNRCVKPTDG